MSEDLTFEDRMFLASQGVYDRIVDGEVVDVEAALMDAHLEASEEGETS
ncbi:hypothetical protein ACIPSE_38005 [Streptomyces sp. NPDC090106]